MFQRHIILLPEDHFSENPVAAFKSAIPAGSVRQAEPVQNNRIPPFQYLRICQPEQNKDDTITVNGRIFSDEAGSIHRFKITGYRRSSISWPVSYEVETSVIGQIISYKSGSIHQNETDQETRIMTYFALFA